MSSDSKNDDARFFADRTEPVSLMIRCLLRGSLLGADQLELGEVSAVARRIARQQGKTFHQGVRPDVEIRASLHDLAAGVAERS